MGSPFDHLRSKHEAMQRLLADFRADKDWADRYEWLLVTSLNQVDRLRPTEQTSVTPDRSNGE